MNISSQHESYFFVRYLIWELAFSLNIKNVDMNRFEEQAVPDRNSIPRNMMLIYRMSSCVALRASGGIFPFRRKHDLRLHLHYDNMYYVVDPGMVPRARTNRRRINRNGGKE